MYVHACGGQKSSLRGYESLFWRWGFFLGARLTDSGRLASQGAPGHPPCLPLQLWNHKSVLAHTAFSHGIWGLSAGPSVCMRSPFSTESRSPLRKTFLASDFLPFHIPHRYFQYNQVCFP